MNVIPPVQNTNNIRVADFVRLIGDGIVARISTAAVPITVSAVDSNAFDALGILLSIGNVQRDIKATSNDTSFVLTGIDTAVLADVLSSRIKGASLQMWHGFFDNNGNLLTTGGTGGLYQYFDGYVTSYGISETWDDVNRMLVGVISISATSSKLILQNRTSGRFTNTNSWKFFNPSDTSMDRVAYIANLNLLFGKRS